MLLSRASPDVQSLCGSVRFKKLISFSKTENLKNVQIFSKKTSSHRSYKTIDFAPSNVVILWYKAWLIRFGTISQTD